MTDNRPAVRTALATYYGAFFANLGILLPFLPPWLQSRGLAPIVIGALLALQPIAKLSAPWTWGRWADRTGRRAGLWTASAGLSAVMLLVLGVAVPERAWMIAVLLAAYAFASSPGLPYAEATALEAADRQGFAYGRVRLWGSVTFILASLGFGAVADRIGERSGFVLGAIALTVATVAAAVASRAAHGWRPVAGRPAERVSPPIPIFPGGALRLFVACAAMQASHGAYYAFFSIRLRELGWSGLAIGAAWAFAVAVEVALFTRADAWVSRIGTSAVLRGCLVAAAVRWGVLAVTGHTVAVVATQPLHALTYAAFHVAALREVHARFPSTARATGQALYSGLSYGAGGIVGTLTAGVVVERADIPTAFAVAATIAVVGAIVSPRLRISGANRVSHRA